MKSLPVARLSLPPSSATASPPPLVSQRGPAIYLTLTGALRVETRLSRCVVPLRHAACVPPGVAHAVSAVVQTEAVALSLPARHAPYLAPHMGDAAQVHAAPQVLQVLATDAATWTEDPPPPAILDASLQAVCGLFHRWCGPALALDLPYGRSEGLRLGLAHLVGRLDRPVGLADAAEAAGLSSRTLQRRCTDELHQPLTSWLTRARVLYALELLTAPDLPVAAAARRAGYLSPAAFTRAFSQQLGHTPSAWRAAR